MADLKISALTALTAPVNADLLAIVDIDGTPTTKKITMANAMKGITNAGAYTVTGATALNGGLTLTNTIGMTIGNCPTGILMNDVGATGEHIIDVKEAYLGLFVETGDYSDTADKGITLATGNKRPVSFLFDDSGDALGAGDYRGVLSRIGITGATTAAVTLDAIRGQVKFIGGVNYEGDYVSGVKGYIEIASTSDFTLNSADHAVSALHGRIEVGGNVTIGTANTYLAGLFLELNTTGSYTITQTGILAGVVVEYTDAQYDKWGYGMYIADGATDIGIRIGTCTTHAISVSAAQTGSAYHVGDTWKLGTSDGAINIGGDATIAFGSVLDTICVERVDVSAQLNAAEKYLFGTYRTLTTTGAGGGSVLQHGIWMGDYTKMTIAHNTTDAYAVRGKVEITGAVVGNMMVGVMGSVNLTEALTAEDTGGVKGGDFAITSSGSGACNRPAAAVWADMTGNENNLVGNMAAVWARLGDNGYSDYLLYAQVGNNNLQTAAIGIVSTDSAVIPVGVLFAGGLGSITSAMTFTGTTTYLFDFDNSTDGSPFTKTTTDLTGLLSGLISVKDQDGTIGYINVWHD